MESIASVGIICDASKWAHKSEAFDGPSVADRIHSLNKIRICALMVVGTCEEMMPNNVKRNGDAVSEMSPTNNLVIQLG